jgi:xylose isomerase
MYQMPDLRYQKTKHTPESLLKHMQTFKLEPKFSVGVWFFAPGGGRFHDRYVDPMSIEERLNIAAEMKSLGVKAVEAHYPAEINWDNIDLYKNLQKQGVTVAGIPFSHFYDKAFEFGALSNPNPEVRKKAIDISIDAMKIAKELNVGAVISWPGIDGFMYDIGTIYPWMWEWYDEGMAQAMDAVPGVRVALEPKPYEPAINNIFRTTGEGILAAQRIEAKLKNDTNRKLLADGHALFGLNPEFGHVRMGYEPAGSTYYLVGMEGRLAHTHWNSQPLGNFDQDLNVGVVDIQQSIAMMYSLKMMGYKEYYGIDINPEHMPVQTAIEININMIKKLAAKVDALPHDKIIDCYIHPDKNRGTLEKILMDKLY